MTCRRYALLLLLFCISASLTRPVRSRERPDRANLVGESFDSARRLEAADRLAMQGQVIEAAEEYHRILAEISDGADLAPVSDQHCVQVRWLCHRRLAHLPAAGLRHYRSRVDPQAKKWLAEAKAGRDSHLAERVVEEAFCSSVTDQALEFLGDLAFERGRWDLAAHWWRLIVLPASQALSSAQHQDLHPLSSTPAGYELLFPTPKVDVARIRAKQIMVRLFQRDRHGLIAEQKAFRKLHNDARGRLAGREGNYAAILQTLSEEDPSQFLLPGQGSWPTFAGDETRQCVLPPAPSDPNRLNSLCLHGPAWRFHLIDHVRLPEEKVPTLGSAPHRLTSQTNAAKFLVYHPILVGKHAVVADSRSVAAYDLANGTVQVWDREQDGRQVARKLLRREDPGPADVRYTVTAVGRRIYARLGGHSIDQEKKGEEADSSLVCLALQPDGGLRLCWEATPLVENPTDACTVFEGSPLVTDGRAYIASTTYTNGQVATALNCYLADGDRPVRLWRKELCAYRDPSLKEARCRLQLLSRAGPYIVYCSHAGAIVAVHADTGRHAWAVRYASRGYTTDNGEPTPRDLVPSLCASGLVYAAPADSDVLWCLDACTGQVVWQREKIEVIHLLGVGAGRLIFTTRTPRPGLRAVNARDGVDSWFQTSSDSSGVVSWGRGFLAGEWIFWPTVRGITVLHQEDGCCDPIRWTPGPLSNIRPGNLVYGDGCLAVADATELSLYVRPSLLLPHLRQAAQAQPDSLYRQYLLARSEADAGMHRQALQRFSIVEQTTDYVDKSDRALFNVLHGGVPAILQTLIQLGDSASDAGRQKKQLIGWACAEHHALLLTLGEQARRHKLWESAAAYFNQAAAPQFPLRARLLALERLAACEIDGGRPERAVAAWQSILEDATLRQGQLFDWHGNPQPADNEAQRSIDALIQKHGRFVYEAMERRADSFRDLASSSPSARSLEELVKTFPQAGAAQRALLQLAEHYSKTRSWGRAAAIYRRMLQRFGQEKEIDRAIVLAKLAEVYERQQSWRAASRAWEALARDYGDRVLPFLDPDGKARTAVRRRLQKPGYQTAAPADAREPKALNRTWEISLAADERCLSLAPSSAPCERERFFARGRELICRDADTGKERWRRQLPSAVQWIACQADVLLAAGPEGIWGLIRQDGDILWSFYPPERLDCLTNQQGPRLGVAATSPAVGARTGPLNAFHLAADRLFCLQDERCLLAIDNQTGRVAWSCWAPSAKLGLGESAGGFGAFYYGDPKFVAISTTKGAYWLLDTQTGRKIRECQTGSGVWLRPPVLAAANRLAVVGDFSRIVLLNLATGEPEWRWEIDRVVSLTGEPLHVIGASDALLVLIRRNFATMLQKLNPETGSPLWEEELEVGPEPTPREAVTCDREAVYYVNRRHLTARSLQDGRLLWDVPLLGPSGSWRLQKYGAGLLAFPTYGSAERLRTQNLPVVIELDLTYPAQDKPGDCFPIVYCDRRNGRLIQRFDFAPWLRPVQASAAWNSDFKGIPELRCDKVEGAGVSPVVQLFPRQAMVVLPGKAWGLAENVVQEKP